MIVENSIQILQSIYSNQNLYRADCRPCQNASVEKQVQTKQPDIVRLQRNVSDLCNRYPCLSICNGQTRNLVLHLSFKNKHLSLSR